MNNKTKKLTTIGMLCAVTYVVMLVTGNNIHDASYNSRPTDSKHFDYSYQQCNKKGNKRRAA